MPGTDYVVRVSSPADYSGLEGLVPRMDDAAQSADQLQRKIDQLSSKLATIRATSFTITSKDSTGSTQTADTSVVSWMLLNP